MEKKKMKLGKKILIGILIIVAILAILVGRKMIMIAGLQKKASQYANIKNYYMRLRLYEGDKIIQYEGYNLGEKYLKTMRSITEQDEGVSKMIVASDGKNKTTYIENKEGKIAILNSHHTLIAGLESYGYTDNWGQLFIKALTSSVKVRECNGKKCYLIVSIQDVNGGTYFDKETGLIVRECGGKATNNDTKETINTILDYQYEFNKVVQSDLEQPDIKQYKIVEMK